MRPTTSKVSASGMLLFISYTAGLVLLMLPGLVCGYAIGGGNNNRHSSVGSSFNAAARDYAEMEEAIPQRQQQHEYHHQPHEHPTKEDLFDLDDWEQVDERYDPRLLSEDLINESQSDADHKGSSRRRLAEHCYFEDRKYEHGQKIPRPHNPCESCVCVDGETFCWWKECEPTKKATTAAAKKKKAGKAPPPPPAAPPSPIKTTNENTGAAVASIRKKAKLFTKPFSATTAAASASGSSKATSGSHSKTAPSAHHHQATSSSSTLTRVGGKKLPLNILNFPHNLPVHLSEIDLMIESDGGALTRSPVPKVAEPVVPQSPPRSTTTSATSTSSPTPQPTSISSFHGTTNIPIDPQQERSGRGFRQPNTSNDQNEELEGEDTDNADRVGEHVHRTPTTNGPITPVPGTATASTTNYGDETTVTGGGIGTETPSPESINDDDPTLNSREGVDGSSAVQGIAPWSPHSINGNEGVEEDTARAAGDTEAEQQTAAINRNQPQQQQKSRVKGDQPSRKDKVDDDDDDDNSSAEEGSMDTGENKTPLSRQVTENINDVKNKPDSVQVQEEQQRTVQELQTEDDEEQQEEEEQQEREREREDEEDVEALLVVVGAAKAAAAAAGVGGGGGVATETGNGERHSSYNGAADLTGPMVVMTMTTETTTRATLSSSTSTVGSVVFPQQQQKQQQQQDVNQWTDDIDSRDSSLSEASEAEAAPEDEREFIRKISIEDDSAKHYIITSSGDIENIPLANQHLVSQFRENFINEIMPLNSVEKAVRVDVPPQPTLILDTYPSPVAQVTWTNTASGSSNGNSNNYHGNSPSVVGATASIIGRDDNFGSTIAAAGASSSASVGGVGIGGFGGAPTLSSGGSSYDTKIFIPSGLASPSGRPANNDQNQRERQETGGELGVGEENGDEDEENNKNRSTGSQESVQVWNGNRKSVQSGSGAAGASVASNKDSAVAAGDANANNKTRDPVCIVMGQTYKVGMVLPQEVGNCLQCVCVEGSSADDGGSSSVEARVTCSPHNCPPLILPDLFDTTGY